MKWFILLVGIVVLCGVVALVLGYVGGGMGRATSTLSHEPLPDGELTDADFEQLRFDVGLRGYRMSEVDSVIARLHRELREKDDQIAVLRSDDPGAVRREVAESGEVERAKVERGEVERGEVERAEVERGEAPPAE